jgi:hypothetical protein
MSDIIIHLSIDYVSDTLVLSLTFDPFIYLLVKALILIIFVFKFFSQGMNKKSREDSLLQFHRQNSKFSHPFAK